MIELLSNKNPCNNCNLYNPCTGPCDRWHEWNSSVLSKLAAYEIADKEGILNMFPCKVGDTLFVITPDIPTGIETTKCIRLSIDKRGITIQAPSVYDDWGNAKWNFKPTDFGKKVFLDFEEAKKALREREGIHE